MIQTGPASGLMKLLPARPSETRDMTGKITTEDWREARRTAVPHQVPEMAAKIARARRQMEEIARMSPA